MKSTSAILCSVLALAAASAQADQLPDPKAGLWEVKIKLTATGAADLPEATTRYCVDDTYGKERNCSQSEVKKTAAGYIEDAVCQEDDGATTTIHEETTGDLNVAYSRKQQAHVQGGRSGGETGWDWTSLEEHKWLAAVCPPEDKAAAGDQP
ncbi:MAG: hypothetical protein LBV49_10165 [Azonexus sp.]|jgi:hypothetical protein|nr:hypothetical protein [Azonexus sp.]